MPLTALLLSTDPPKAGRRKNLSTDRPKTHPHRWRLCRRASTSRSACSCPSTRRRSRPASTRTGRLLGRVVRLASIPFRVRLRLGALALERVDRPGVLGWMQWPVREQPVPVGIVAFTVFEMALWAARQEAAASYVGTRRYARTSPSACAHRSSAPAHCSKRRSSSSSATRRRSRATCRRTSVRSSGGRSRACARRWQDALRRGVVHRGARASRRRGGRPPRPVAQERGPRVRRVDPRRDRRSRWRFARSSSRRSRSPAAR